MTTGFGSFDAECHGRATGPRHHVWQSPHTHNRACVQCGTLATEFFKAATQARADFADTVRAPLSAHGKAKK